MLISINAGGVASEDDILLLCQGHLTRTYNNKVGLADDKQVLDAGG